VSGESSSSSGGGGSGGGEGVSTSLPATRFAFPRPGQELVSAAPTSSAAEAAVRYAATGGHTNGSALGLVDGVVDDDDDLGLDDLEEALLAELSRAVGGAVAEPAAPPPVHPRLPLDERADAVEGTAVADGWGDGWGDADAAAASEAVGDAGRPLPVDGGGSGALVVAPPPPPGVVSQEGGALDDGWDFDF
jgi:hypothetical protein